MPTFRRFLALDAADRWLAVEATGLVLFVWAGLRILPFRTLRALLDWYSLRDGGVVRRLPDKAAPRVAHIVIAVAAHFPIQTTCLVDALVAETVLRRRGYAASVRFGVRRANGAPIPLSPHAWVECDGAVVIGAVDGLAEYAVLSVPECQ